ncbi:hypothetical protein GOP47_0006234 [Adiantum capillus-veneris]|uniref:Uncharacterized protein n=1 Tax=Adiantum capillus-veneris TaxID=13818 RepID=A0A9D4ZK43_ADICA|nr:hypothetical protein GOP47_0006234 [Adiantum capillus-veneris]
MGHGGDGAADTSEASLDRGKVHVLLCDKDPQSGLQVMQMLQRCSYQVTCVKSAGQVMQVLDSSGNEVDLILAEVELPKEKGFKLLKHIVRQEQLQRIPVVMMSSQDEMALVVRCLKLGAVDFLLKPLRSNELLNLWTHTWRRRRMLGLTERHLMKGNLRVPFDLLVSETSESNNTNSTTLFSDDVEDHKVTNTVSIQAPGRCRDVESELSPGLELSLKPLVEVTSEHGAGSMPSPPRKSELKVGLSSAFLTYNKVSNWPTGQSAEVAHFNTPSNHVPSASLRPDMPSSNHENDDPASKNGDEQEPYSISFVAPSEEHLREREYNPWESNPCSRNECESGYREQLGPSVNHVTLHTDFLGVKLNCGDPFPQEGATSGPSESSHFLVGGMIGPVMPCPPPMLSPGIHMYQNSSTEEGFLAGVAAGIPSLHMPQGLNLTGTFPFYPFGLHMAVSPQPGSFPGWHPAVPYPIIERKLGQAEKREAALNKFRLKRKDRCFEKKIRYVSRKKLAEQRPRIKGQFVRRETNTDVNDSGALDDYEDDDDDQGLCDMGEGSSPESVAEDA